MKKYYAVAHSFVICAYKESPYLEECIKSLLRQTVKSKIIIITSTPNDYISKTALKYKIPLYVNTGTGGLANDWNFAYQVADTSLVTLAHQDDVYKKNYLANTLKAINLCKNPLISFSDYQELRSGKIRKNALNLLIKRGMLFALQCRLFWGSRFLRRRILSFGNPICCPSVTFVKDNLEGFSFKDNMKSNIDWQAWEEISLKKGEFAYINTPCMLHRIHPDSTTTEIIESNRRKFEDYEILRRFWPDFICVIIEFFYRKSELFNKIRI